MVLLSESWRVTKCWGVRRTRVIFGREVNRTTRGRDIPTACGTAGHQSAHLAAVAGSQRLDDSRKPSFSSNRLQRITDCRDDSTHRATSAGRTPRRSSSAASRRRCSSFFNDSRSRLIPIFSSHVTARNTWAAPTTRNVTHLRKRRSTASLSHQQECHAFMEDSMNPKLELPVVQVANCVTAGFG